MPKRRTATILTSLGLCVALAIPVGSAWAYFTSYASTYGSQELHLSAETQITEEFDSWTKHVSIQNSADSVPVFVRVKALSGSTYQLQYTGEDNWTPGPDAEGFYYYNLPVEPGEATSVLDIKISGIPLTPQEGDQFNVVVIYETTPVLYRADGTPYADWSKKLDTGRVEGGEA